MKIRIAVVPSASDDLDKYLPSQAANLATFMRDHCLLLFDSTESQAQFLRSAIHGCQSRELKATWLSLMENRKICRAVPEEQAPQQVDLDVAAIATWRDLADVLTVARYHYEILVQSDPLPEEPELAAIREIRETEAYQRQERMYHDFLRVNESRHKAWAQRFEPYCHCAKEIFVADKFLGTQVWESVTGKGRPMRETGYWWLMNRLKPYPVRRVILGTRLPRGCKPIDFEDAIHRLVTELDPEYQVRLLPVYQGRWPMHYRHIRFDEDAAYQLEKGVDTFADSKFQENYPCNWVPMNVAMEDFARLRAKARYPEHLGLIVKGGESAA